ncbi:uncharacterized protein LOC127721192 [Mytilus californianus]|uniref:uncharacterized protein LOC127721192 n=1 Tax=Mytilus californianus TaxID=6549 RepID=UPI002247D567|nr:uncharacterized protein LOC127721192 [Mytilus californianus]
MDNIERAENLHGIKKTTYWEIYGIKRFPYKGKRKYSPCINQTFDGSIVLKNDVFGLSIRQFEREFKNCLERRRKDEQTIINIRFPDKTSNEYMEYLEIFNIQNLEDQSHTAVYQSILPRLMNIVGSEKDIRERQRLFLQHDLMINHGVDSSAYISSGSLAEGIDLPGSDIDIMIVMKEFQIIKDKQHINLLTEIATLLMEVDAQHPGFSKLKLVNDGGCTNVFLKKCLTYTIHGTYWSSTMLMSALTQKNPFLNLHIHGPCLSDEQENQDLAFCLRSHHWPCNAEAWIYRHRSVSWPSSSLIEKIVSSGCMLVPIGPKNEDKNENKNELLWRVSFSVAEKLLCHSFNYTQFLCYSLLKLVLKHFINIYDEAKDLLCSYFLKTALFWLSEEIPMIQFRLSNFINCFFLCLDKLVSWIKLCYCPNYFIPEHNMFIGKIDHSNNYILLNILHKIKRNTLSFIFYRYLWKTLSASSVMTESSVKLDFLSFRLFSESCTSNVDQGYKTLQFIENLAISERSKLSLGMYEYIKAEIHQILAQMVPLPCHSKKDDVSRKSIQKHLQEGTKTDSVSGWVLYASFYYVCKQYKIALQIIDHVMSRCTPDVVELGIATYNENHTNDYQQKTSCSNMTLNEKMRMAIMRHIKYETCSSLIPQEFQSLVKKEQMIVPPLIMSHCLRFLSYSHLNDAKNAQNTLKSLQLTVKNVPTNCRSVSLSILGICNELLGDKKIAEDCYDEALSGNDRCRIAYQKKVGMSPNTKEFVIGGQFMESVYDPRTGNTQISIRIPMSMLDDPGSPDDNGTTTYLHIIPSLYR